MADKNKLIIFGSAGTAVEVKEIIKTCYPNKFSAVKVIFYEEDFVEKNNLTTDFSKSEKPHFIAAMADYKFRNICCNHAEKLGMIPTTIIHPSAVVFKSASIGVGSYIGANVTISSDAKVSKHCMININATLGHHAELAEHVIVLPGARVSGNVKIGKASLIGSNAFLFQGITIGEHNLVDALTYIDKDLPKKMISSSKQTKSFRRISL